jgi:hypothetical protein
MTLQPYCPHPSVQLRQPELMHAQRMSEANRIRKTDKPKLSIIQRRLARRMPISRRSSKLALKISCMRLAIAPIVHVQTGLPGAGFPDTMLHLFLLTESQLDQLAQYYSQITPCELTHQYPQTMDWSKPFLCTDDTLPDNCKLSELERVKVKMRMFARFIGMRGTETPLWECERQVEILHNKVRRSVEEEEKSLRKAYLGPGYTP